MSDSLAYKTATELAFLIRNRYLSPVEVVEYFIDRIESKNEKLNAFIFFGFEEAYEKAKLAEDMLMSGEKIGLMHGVPTALKDLFDTYPGWPTTYGGLKEFKEYKPNTHTSIYAERMEKSGAILLGKTNSPVLGFRATTDNYLFGPTKNPFDLTKNSGGSSGGSAAAVASGLIPFSEGTDAGGSIRVPASWCGLYGFKPSFGRIPFISRPNAFKGGMNSIVPGVLTRTVEDTVLALNVLTGEDKRDPFSIKNNLNIPDILNIKINELKIAYSPNFDVFPIDNEISNLIKNGVKFLADAGACVEEIKLGINYTQQELSDLWLRLVIGSNVGILEEFQKKGVNLLQNGSSLPKEYLQWLERGSQLNIFDINRDQKIKTHLYDTIEATLNKFDFIVSPTTACLPVSNSNDGNTLGPSNINGENIDPLIGWCLTHMTNLTGHPSAVVPVGISKEKLPVGMQIIGKKNEDIDVLELSAVYERINPWYKIYDNIF